MYVPYDPALLTRFWNSIFTTVGSVSNLGFYFFLFIVGILVFRAVVDYFI